jgi:hypothetical protein
LTELAVEKWMNYELEEEEEELIQNQIQFHSKNQIQFYHQNQ